MFENLIDKLEAIHGSLAAAGLPHAFGGALALAWCIPQARTTMDVDINVFIGTDSAASLRRALPEAVTVADADIDNLRREGQARLWWDGTPVDIFLNSIAVHEQAARRTVYESLGGMCLPFLSCLDTAIFKALFNRSKDWVDLEEMHRAGNLNIAYVRQTVGDLLGSDDERLRHLDSLARTGRAFRRF